MKTYRKEIFEAIEEIKKLSTENKELPTDHLEILLIASLLEEENTNDIQ